MASDSEATPPIKTYQGNCHCGAVKFTVEHPSIEDGHQVSSCNCSICSRNGYLFIYPKKSEVSILAGEEQLKGYRSRDTLALGIDCNASRKDYHFGNKMIAHKFCPLCGTSIMAIHPDHENIAVNVRTFTDFDVDVLTISKFEKGKDLQPPYTLPE